MVDPLSLDPLRLGPLTVDPPVVLAPMAGVTNAAYRSLCREQGAGLYVCEMITSRGVVERDDTTLSMLVFDPGESVRSVQLYGVDPVYMARATEILCNEYGVRHIDLNFGCPVPKVTRKGGGAALPWKRRLLGSILEAAVAAAFNTAPAREAAAGFVASAGCESWQLVHFQVWVQRSQRDCISREDRPAPAAGGMHDAGQGQGVGGQRARVGGAGQDAAQFWGLGLGERVGQRHREVQQRAQDVVIRLAGGGVGQGQCRDRDGHGHAHLHRRPDQGLGIGLDSGTGGEGVVVEHPATECLAHAAGPCDPRRRAMRLRAHSRAYSGGLPNRRSSKAQTSGS